MSNWRRKTERTSKYSTFSGFPAFPREGSHHCNKDVKEGKQRGRRGKESKSHNRSIKAYGHPTAARSERNLGPVAIAYRKAPIQCDSSPKRDKHKGGVGGKSELSSN